MKIIEHTDKEKWNQKISSHEKSQFLQSWEWGEFQEKVGRKVWRLEIDGQTISVIKHNLPLGKSYLYVPRTAIEGAPVAPGRLQDELKNLAQQEKAVFIRIEPVKQLSITCPEATRGINYQLSIAKPVQPSTTLYLDLTKSEQELLQAMHQKTRYNIRLAEKHGVTVKESSDINEFLKLNQETVKRDKFKSHNDDYYRKMFKVLGNQAIKQSSSQAHAKLFVAYYKDKPLSTNLIIFFSDTATYLHGASSNQHRNLMAPHLLQWEVIKYAMSHGYKWYDFWGVNPSRTPYAVGHKSGWEGITRFKRGFVSESTGQEVTYPGCFDLPISKFWYILYKAFKSLRA